MSGRPREPAFKVAPSFKEEFRALLARFPEIGDTIKIFNTNKRTIPPTPLPGEMRDHKLGGALKGVRECHLSGDVLLLYEHEDDEVRMLCICQHEDLYGKRGRQLATKVGRLRTHLKGRTVPARRR